LQKILGQNSAITADKNIAKTVYQSARVDSTAEYTTVGTVPSLGREFAFTEYSINADLNKWSQPVKGNMGVYLINLRYKTQFVQATYDMQKAALRNEILQQKKNTYMNQWIQDLKKHADITDNRYLFYR
jgi:peptidyl-prolyl cis-trans isomerase D